MTVPAPAPYPIRFDLEYPDRPLNRATTAFRIFLALPVLAVLGAVSAWSFQGGAGNRGAVVWGSGGLLALGPALMIVFRQKYPRWWFDWNRALLAFTNRVIVYLALLRDEYPATDHEQAVRLELPYPDVPNDLSRWLPLVKWLLAIPHVIVLVFVDLVAVIIVVIAWFAILFTGRYPRPLFDFVVGAMRWGNRVIGYALILVTDRYPPFRLRD